MHRAASLLINELSLSWSMNFRLLSKGSVAYRIQKRQSLFPILNQINPVYTYTFISFKSILIPSS
jgi:hypothetical protein